MKTIVKMALPIAAFVLASAGAVTSHEAKQKVSDNPVLITGYIQNPSTTSCLAVQVDCSTFNSGEACMSDEATERAVWLKNDANACVRNLYKVIQP